MEEPLTTLARYPFPEPLMTLARYPFPPVSHMLLRSEGITDASGLGSVELVGALRRGLSRLRAVGGEGVVLTALSHLEEERNYLERWERGWR